MHIFISAIFQAAAHDIVRAASWNLYGTNYSQITMHQNIFKNVGRIKFEQCASQNKNFMRMRRDNYHAHFFEIKMRSPLTSRQSQKNSSLE